MRIKELWVLLKQTFQSWNEDKAARLAAALAYYAVFAMAPVLIIVLAVAGQVLGGSAAQTQVLQQLRALIGPEGATFVQTILENARKPVDSSLASLISLLTLILGAAGAYGQLQDALNTIWGVEAKAGGVWQVVKDRFLAFIMVVGTGGLLLVSLIVSALLSALNNPLISLVPQSAGVLPIVNLVVSFALTLLIFGLIFKVVPDVHLRWRDIWPGALLTTLLFTWGKYIIGLYLSHSSISSTYGAAGSLVIILLWVYYSAQIFFLGAEFTKVYAKKCGSPVRPTLQAKPVTAEMQAQQGMPHAQQLEPHSEPKSAS